MSELTLLVLRLAFLLLLWVFVFVVVYTLRSDLFGPRLRRTKAEAAGAGAAAAATAFPSASATAPTAATDSPLAEATLTEPMLKSPPLASERTARRLVVTGGPREGMELELPADQLSIGRSSESGLVVRDDYTSTHHARLMLWNDQWVVQDLDSTNGTFLDGRRVTVPVPVPLGATVTVGQTTFELRR